MSVTEATPIQRATLPANLCLGGRLVPASSGATFDVRNPATGAVIAEVANATAQDANHALDLAVDAGREWAVTAPRVRSELLRAAFDLVVSRSEEFADLITADMGKPQAESMAEVAYGAEFLRWFGEEPVRINGRNQSAPNGTGHIATVKMPVGPAPL